MLMFRTRTRKTGLLAIAVIGTTFAACSKDDKSPDSRQRTYQLVATGGTTASITATENADSSFNLSMTLNKSTKDTTYFFNVIRGSIGSPTTDTMFKLGSLKSTADGSTLTKGLGNFRTIILPGQTTPSKFTYDSLIKYQSYATISFVKATPPDSIVAKGNMYQP